jgi:hypothetical protein
MWMLRSTSILPTNERKMMQKLAPSWQTTLTAAIRRDPKKAGVLGVLLAVLLVVGGRAAIGSKAIPTPAVAGTKTSKPKTDNARGIRVAGRKNNTAAMRTWLSTSLPRLDRNLFAVKLDNYPQLSGKKSKNSPIPTKELTAEEKSAAQTVDEKKEKQTLTEAMQLQARQYKLTSTVTGALPKALINGEMVKEGDVVASGPTESPEGDPLAGFRVLKIEARRVIIEREGIKLEILMK